MNKFKAGQELSAHSLCNYDCIFTGKVLKRTPKMITVKVKAFSEKRCKIHISDEGEFIYPLGRYSMAPIFRS